MQYFLVCKAFFVYFGIFDFYHLYGYIWNYINFLETIWFLLGLYEWSGLLVKGC